MPVSRANDTGEKLERLRRAHADFLARLAEFEKEEKELARKIREMIDKKKIHDVLDKILQTKTD